jgi:hypothetical protein
MVGGVEVTISHWRTQHPERAVQSRAFAVWSIELEPTNNNRTHQQTNSNFHNYRFVGAADDG